MLGILVGAAPLAWSGVLREIAGGVPGVRIRSPLSATQAAILWQLRLPRVALGGLVGAALAGAGASYQGVFRNPLADPYLLGAAAGAGLGATLAIILLPGAEHGLIGPLPAFAFAGALVGVTASYALGRSRLFGGATDTLILAGVAVASFLTALQTFAQQRQSDTLRIVYSWILGRLGTAGWQEVLLVLPYIGVAAVVMLMHGRMLDVLAVGDDEASALGISPSRVRLVIVAAATLATAAAVAVSGLIGFVGIIVPHTLRLIVGPSYRRLLPLTLVGGAAFLIVADVLARTIVSPAELPIGVVTAFFGAPFFVLVLRMRSRA
jgi:iron complex transport system permease protein